MTENLTYNREKSWDELLEKARAEGITEEFAFRELVDGYFEGLVDVGELDANQNVTGLKAEVLGQWARFEVDLGTEDAPTM